MSIVAQVQADVKKIAADVASVGASVAAILTVVENSAPSFHLNPGATAALASVSAIVATVVLEARRLAGAAKAKPAA